MGSCDQRFTAVQYFFSENLFEDTWDSITFPKQILILHKRLLDWLSSVNESLLGECIENCKSGIIHQTCMKLIPPSFF